ncbi:MAG: 23S rRNA (guanosine(2251)-2'-O)-methyltransferase RlmB [Lentimicrobiaceae bacterium]|jgi:23S rRNA (guanosine2251-2'-O)-methyltransferase|nr:23S rRNA (guanosine(2251)-2'-O)-methyltransferase RlmB [Lentimicrobiaceae bacterium]MCP4909901.1 23S rRNA (guanosine(2251)-2'-O)-methyltransferase RlmB [Bacteroidota bacterium]MBT3453694.1 23S rRNA (guanosine(2251)-2'-O)-methyltransferase RlmB [Lentimicrobiaceae bacterium]MBT3818221.1 23S rRNA (guanosine(2251)-2'-O)-methyltransferase RlmB [Lentimicrobiaceae bacterium]MBT4061767.1 23S rRNA (guanosine(2251)-2'-O)-methyltransferase RlmB [Lentimicrobiaceae bacterium]
MIYNKKKEDSENIVIGIRPVIEAIKADKEIDRVFIQNGLRSELFRELMTLLKSLNIPYKYVPVVKLNKITRKNHQGIIAYVSPVDFSSIEELIPSIYERGEEPFILILDKITDVRNFGAILRTAESAGINGVLIPAQGAALLNSGTIKSSAGAIFNVTICRTDNLKLTIDFLKNSGLKIASATEKGAELYYKSDLTGPIAIIMGSEDSGVSQEYLKRSDEKLMIPMVGKTESLNVSVAAGIILFEAVRQRS